VDVPGELGRGGDLAGSSGSGAAASAAAWPSGTGAYSLSSGIAVGRGRMLLAEAYLTQSSRGLAEAVGVVWAVWWRSWKARRRRQ
jgi:hypothetical protein